MRSFPALDILWPSPPAEETIDLLLAEIHDAAPTAVEPQPAGVRVFFGNVADRERALLIIHSSSDLVRVQSLLVPDEEWAERSQASLTAIRAGAIVVSPPWIPPASDADAATIHLVIQPSMGFGTGHHASTRLCLHLLQRRRLQNALVLDIGTGSGVLALAAWRLGAPRVIGIDADPDALASAAENVALNHATQHVELQLVDLAHASGYFLQRFDAITANLTGAMLMRYAPDLARLVARRGCLIVSGFQTHEAAAVEGAFAEAGLRLAAREEETDWVALELVYTQSQ